MELGIITLFPQLVADVFEYGINSRAVKNGLVEYRLWNPRDFTDDKHQTVDDRPYGGGPGMLMKVEPLYHAIQQAKSEMQQPRVVYLSPHGQRMNQQTVDRLKSSKSLLLIAGRYEGIDQRLIDDQVDEQISIGDYVLSGGELPAMVLIDSLIRQIPGALGHEDSAQQDSFNDGLLDCPHYTRPEEILGHRVPDVLLGGDHKKIEQWRRKQSLGLTWKLRPDLLEETALSDADWQLLQEFIKEQGVE
jgi:tRNA (guanine37-N1)-methyltransferase